MDDRTCTIDGCEKRVRARGWCATHYDRNRLYGSPTATPPPRARRIPDRCAVSGCERDAKSRGWCLAHYKRWRKWGDPEGSAPKLPTECAFPGCEKPRKAKGLCIGHHAQQKRGKPLTPLFKPQLICSIDRCELPHRMYGYCEAHAHRFVRTGDPQADRPLRGWYDDPEMAFISRTERRGACLIWTGSLDKKGYGSLRIKGKLVPAHRYAWERANGPIPLGKHVDHRYHCNTACCEATHLRLTTPGQNNSHRSGPVRTRKYDLPRNVERNGSGYAVRLTHQGKRMGFGTYRTVEEATEMAARARAEVFGDYAGKG